MRQLLKRVTLGSLVLCAVPWMACRAVAPQAPVTHAASEARSAHGMVVSGSALATQVGVRVLEEGGTAVDAAVATAFALAVVEPSMSGIGGRTQILIRLVDGSYHGIDGATQVPASYAVEPPLADEDAYGHQTVAIPGTVAALARALSEHGTWPLARALAPAIELAERGFILPADEAARIASAADRLREFPAAARYFLLPDGTPLPPGHRFVQQDLGRTLRSIAQHGAAVFYRGEIARQIAEGITVAGGTMTEADLAAYRAEDAIVVRGRYRGRELAGTYLPASGATTIQVLQIMEHFDLPRVVGTSDWVSITAQALLIGFADRVETEPPVVQAARITSPEFAALRAADIRTDDALRLRPSGSIRGAAAPSPAGADLEPEHTTHLSVVDAAGNAVALTQSVGPTLGAIAAADGLGFVYGATMGYLGGQRAGARPMSSQSPLIVVEGDRPIFVLGAAGARRIIPAIVAVLSRTIDAGYTFPEAMAAPRFHALESRIDMEVRPGTQWADSAVQRLRGLGFNVAARDDAPYFARINGIAWDARAREYVGVADPRWLGAAAGPRRRY